MIQAVLFDLDETLVDRTETMRKFLMGQHKRVTALNSMDCFEYVDACLKYQENGYADKHDAYKLACEAIGPSVANLADLLVEDFKEYYGKEPVLFPGVLDTLSILHKSYIMGLVSNGRTKVQAAKIEASGIARFFSSVCISEAIGVKKPDREIFIKCLDDLSVKPLDAVFVGDNPSLDIEPAKALGMRAIWRRNGYFPEPQSCDGIYSNIDELPGMLKNVD
ncbi:MAG: hypothetical protein CMQ37_03705 [Gammaproteobacteria bacterium]|nr:hypothetical protein [Gammaproteobacteria bacterium]|tara:strand:+ start:2038 stop:2700 length:663 start_codon:yes stop_codon:yes gene_type:complete